MKKQLLFFMLSILFVSVLNAQVKIGGTGNPDANAVLELDGGTNKGLLLPRLTNDRMNAMTTAPNGMIIFNTTDGFIYCRTFGAWQKIAAGGSSFSLPFADTVNMNGGFLFDIAKDGTGGGAIIGKGINNATGVIGYSLNGTGVVGNSENGTGGYFSSLTGPAIYAGGNIGVNEPTPHSPLTFTNSNGNKIAFGGTNNSHFGIGMQNQLLQFSVPDNTAGFGFGFGSSNNFTERLRITGEGHVGINHGAPYAPLTIGSDWGSRIAFLGDASIQYGLGIQPNLMQLYTPTQFADFGFGYGNSSNFTEVMRIKGNGTVGIGTNTPAASAKLDITSTNKGFLTPRMTSANRNAIALPAKGLMVYDSTTNSHWYHNGSTWVNMIDYSTLQLPFDTTVNMANKVFRIHNTGTAASIIGSSENQYGIGITGTTTGDGGWGVNATSTEANAVSLNAYTDKGTGIKVLNNNTANTNPAVDATTNGTGPAGKFRVQNNSGNANAFEIFNNGLGNGLHIQLTNTFNNAKGINVVQGGTGTGIFGSSISGTGIKGEGGTGSNGTIGVAGTSLAANGTGVSGSSAEGVGVSGTSGTGYGVAGFSTSGVGIRASSVSGTALDVFGKMKITGLNTPATNGAVLTSDANGNADWVNNKVAFRARGAAPAEKHAIENAYTKVEFEFQDYDFTNGYTVYAGTVTPNTSTFLIPKSGVYHLDAAVRIDPIPFLTNRHVFIQLVVKRDNVVSVIAENEVSPFHDYGTSVNVSTDIKLQANDRIWVEFKHTNIPGTAIALLTYGHNVYFSGHLVVQD